VSVADVSAGQRVLFEWLPAAPPRSLRGYGVLGIIFAGLAAWTAFSVAFFGPGWLIVGIIGFVIAIGYDEWMRFTRDRFRLAVTEDGALHVETWSGSDRHWLPLMKEVRRTSRSFSTGPQRGWSRNSGYRYILELDQEDGPTARVPLPGGSRFFSGSGRLMPDEDFERFSVAVSRWCPVRRA
jgi:hypothetical protein